MRKNKMIAKSCPKCDLQVAVATKACKCGHSFFSSKTRRPSSGGEGRAAVSGESRIPLGSSSGPEGRRRTGRVRRARPHFYDSQDYQRQKRKVPKRRSISQGSFDEDERRRDRSKDSTNKDGVSSGRVGRRRGGGTSGAGRGGRSGEQKAPPPEPPPNPARLLRCATLLQEINRKMSAVTWSPN